MATNSRGYSYRIVEAVRAADSEEPGVQLGLLCIAKDIPVTEVAHKLGVSRQTVYYWMTERFKPRSDQLRRIEAFMAEYA